MTYCVGMLLDKGLVMAADTRTNAGVDHVASFRKMRLFVVEGNRVILSFDHVGGGLVVKGSKLIGFTISGADQKFVPAEAEIKGKKVIVHSSAVAQPVAVRFGWENWPVLNFWNKAGLPATPFRTDDFPMVTAPKK